MDDDVAAALEQLRRTRGGQFKSLVNDLLREGLRRQQARPARRAPFRTRSVDLGRARATTLDNLGEVLAIAEGDGFR
jgi:hypothetical protein